MVNRIASFSLTENSRGINGGYRRTVGTEEWGKVFVKKITSCFIRNY